MERNAKGYLNIVDGNGYLTRYCLDSFGKSEVKIGRNADVNDIVLTDSYVAREHGVFYVSQGRYYYQDINDSNGSHVITPGFRGHLRRDRSYVELDEDSIIKLGSMKKTDKMTVIWLTYMDDNESLQAVPLHTNAVRIGRAASNDIVLKHPNVSKFHAYVSRDSAGNVVITDDRSRSGVMVNGTRITGSAPLRDKDIIQILGFQLLYSNNIIYYKRKVSGICISASNVTKIVDKGKKILTDVNVEIRGNEFVAIIGGSGAGKSTLMGVLNGFDRKYTGNVYYNSISIRENFSSIKDIIGYVPQEDIVYENLTLRDMLRYTAQLRMPADYSNAEIEERIDEVLNTLDLQKHQDTYIRKMSGGQKKRASIAVELLADPKVFFLDEPTSGLDPGTEKNLMLAMSKLSKEQERTIIMVTHTTQSLHLCDKVIFMGPGGRVCFVGNVNEARQFFGTDDLTDIYNKIADEPEYWANMYAASTAGRYRTSVEGEKSINAGKRNRVSGLYQFSVIFARYVKLCLNDWRKTAIQILTPVIMGLIVWFIADEKFLAFYSPTKSILFTISCAAIWIGLFAAIQEICKERGILKREYMANLRLRSYISAKFAVIAIQGVIQALLLVGVAFVGLNYKYAGEDDIDLVAKHTLLGNDGNITWEVLITVWLTIIASAALGLLISSFFKNGDKATTLAPFVLIVQLVFSGMLFTLEGAKETISYITFSRWSVDALGRIVNIKSLENPLHIEDEHMFDWAADKLMGDWGILLGMTVVCLIAAAIALRNISRDSR